MHNYTLSLVNDDIFAIPNVSLLRGLDNLEESAVLDLRLGFKEYYDDPESYKEFRACFIGKDDDGKYNRMSAPLASRDRFMTKQTMKDYCTQKFNQMSKFIFSNTNELKEK